MSLWLTTSTGVHTNCAAMAEATPPAALAIAVAEASEKPHRRVAEATLLLVTSSADM